MIGLKWNIEQLGVVLHITKGINMTGNVLTRGL